MYSSLGLENWELLFVSGMLSVCILGVSAVIGAIVAHVVLREPVVATENGFGTERGFSPQPAMEVSGPIGAGAGRRVAVG